MLQKVDKDRLDKVLAVIEAAKIKFPNATITRELDVHAGTVSAYLNGVKPMSSNFYRKFMDKYGNNSQEEKANNIDENMDKNELSLHSVIESNKSLAAGIRDFASASKEMAETNKELTALLKATINSNSVHSAPSPDVLWTILERIAEQGTKFWGTKEEGLKELGRYLSGGQEKEKPKGR